MSNATHLPLIQLFGGVGVLLFGLHTLGHSIGALPRAQFKKLFGDHLQNAWMATLVGISITVVFQSSVAAMYLFVAIYAARWIAIRSALFLFMGANVGTTIAAALIYASQKALSWSTIALILLGFAGLLRIYKSNWKIWLEPLLGYGFFFLGLSMLSSALASTVPIFEKLIPTEPGAWNSYAIALLGGLVLTLSLQSSLAAILMLFSLASRHHIPIDYGLYAIIGINIGISIPIALAHIHEEKRVFRLALWDMIFNSSTAIFALLFLPFFMPWLIRFNSPVAVLALFHCTFNLSGLCIHSVGFHFLPDQLPKFFTGSFTEPAKPDVSLAQKNPELALAYASRVWSVIYEQWLGLAEGVLLSHKLSPHVLEQKKKEVEEMSEELCDYLESIPLRDASHVVGPEVLTILRCMEHVRMASGFLWQIQQLGDKLHQSDSWHENIIEQKKRVYEAAHLDYVPVGAQLNREVLTHQIQELRNQVLNAAQNQEIALGRALNLADVCSLLDKTAFHIVRARKYYQNWHQGQLSNNP